MFTQDSNTGRNLCALLAILLAPVLGSVVSAQVSIPAVSTLAPATTAGAVDAALPRIIDITWHRGPDLPQGFQDSVGGIVDGTLVSVAGFCRGYASDQVAGKEGKYPREVHINQGWALPLNGKTAAWSSIPAFPGTGRRSPIGVSIQEKLYLWGGCEYNYPFTFKNGFCLSRVQGQWKWDKLPDLLMPVGSSGIASIGPKIYALGGSAYYSPGGGFYLTNVVENGAVLGSQMAVFDTAEAKPAWKALAPCPGTPRCVQAMAAVGGKIYVLGGAAGENNPSGKTCTVVDNWRFDPPSNTWDRLPDLPVASGSFPSGQIVFQDRYILLIGGEKYDAVLGPGNKVSASFGQVTKHDAGKDYLSDIFVFDTQTSTFGTATPMPINNRLPLAIVRGNQLHLLGGETPGGEIDGEKYGHNPDLYLIGDLALAKTEAASK